MELRQLRAFAAVAETGSFSRAAEKLYTSHSSISRAVSTLEQELGVTLIERDNNHVIGLTGAGRIMLEGARELIALEQRLLSRVKAEGGTE